MRVNKRLHISWLGLLLLVVAGEPSASAQQIAYVSNEMANNVAIVNLSNNTVIGTILYSSGGLDGLAITPDGSLIYVAAQSMNTVAVMNTITKTVVTAIPVGTTPTHVAITPDGATAYVVNQASNNVSAINIHTNTVIATIPVGTSPGGIAITPDGSKVLVPNQTSSNISVISVSSNTVVATWTALFGAGAITISPDGSVAYVLNQFANALTVHSMTTGDILATINGFSAPVSVAVTPNGRYLYVINVNNTSVAVIDTTSNQIVASILVGLLPTDVVVSADGSTVYVTNGFGFSLSEISTATNTVTYTLAQVGIYPAAIVLAPGGAANITKSAGDGQSVDGGQAFSPLRVTVTNASGGPVQSAAVSFSVVPGITGASATFSGTPTMPILTDVNGNATAPMLTAGSSAGNFSVTASVNALSTNFSLNDIEVSPTAGVSPSLLSFFPMQRLNTTSSPQTVTLSNTGSGALTISSIALTGANGSEFSIASNTCGASLGAGSNCAIGVIFKPVTNGAKSAALAISSNDPVNPMLSVGISGLGPMGPVAVSASSGYGTSAVITGNFSDGNGGTDIVTTRLLISPSGGAANACYVQYTAGKLYLMNDAGSAWLGAFAPGSGSTAANSQCILNSIGSSYTAASYPATAAALTVNVTFTMPKFAGNKNVYLYAVDTTSLNTGFVLEGAWDIANPGASVSATSLTFPTEAIGTTSPSQNLTLSYVGAPPLTINSINLNGTNAGDFAITSNGCGGILNSGSNCLIALAMDPTAGGPRSATLTISSNDLVNPVLNVALNGMGAVAPAAGSVTPASGSGSTVTFAATYTDTDGGTDIRIARILINGTASVLSGCYVQYSAGKLYLMNDLGTSWLGGIAPGSASSLSNLQCTLNGTGSSYTAAAYPSTVATLVVNINFTMPAFLGNKNVYLSATDGVNLSSGLVMKGKWTVHQ